MTRRDHCCNCGNMVGDIDVMCSVCSCSFHSNCTDAHDTISYICLFNVRILEQIKPSVTKEELHTYYNMLQNNRSKFIWSKDNELTTYFMKLNSMLDDKSTIINMKKLYKVMESYSYIIFDNLEFVCSECC